VGRAEATLREAGAARVDGVADGSTAMTLSIEGLPLAAVRAVLALFEAEADVIAIDLAAPPPRLLVADMDSTMVACECLDELADYAGLKAEVAAITERAMRGELDFAASLTERVALLAGLPTADIALCLSARVSPNPGARTLIATARAHGIRTVLVTGGFTAFAKPVGAMLGFDRVVANRFEIERDQLTGRVVPPIVDAATKRTVLLAEAEPLGGAPLAVAVGDGANDIPMLQAAGLGIAYHAKPKANDAAAARVAHGDLTTLLYAFHIPRADWTILP